MLQNFPHDLAEISAGSHFFSRSLAPQILVGTLKLSSHSKLSSQMPTSPPHGLDNSNVLSRGRDDLGCKGFDVLLLNAAQNKASALAVFRPLV